MKELFFLLRSRPMLASELLIASFFINVLSLVSPLFFILVFNRYVTSGFDGTLITLTAGMVLAVALKAAFGAARNRLCEDVTGEREPLRLQQMFQILLRARPSDLSGLTRSQVMDAIQAPQAGMAASSPQNIGAILDTPFAVLSVFLIFLLSPPLGITTLLAMVVSCVINLAGVRNVRGPARDAAEAASAGRSVAAQALLEPDAVRVFGWQTTLLMAWNDQMRRMHNQRRKIFRVDGASQTGLEVTSLLTRTVIIAVGARLVVQGELSMGALIGVSYLSGMPVAILSRSIRSAATLHSAREQMAAFKNIVSLPLESEQGLAIANFKGRLEFSDLAFGWPGSHGPLFESVSLGLEPGGFLAVSGRNGTGKTTLARLVAGLLDPVRGQILIDGQDLRQVAPVWWRRQIMYLPQEPVFFKASVLENIRVANPGMSDEDVQRVVVQAGLKSFLNAQPRGLAMMIEDGGRTLSPGIRRRLALARALAQDGQVALLDDPTEALDAEGCKFVHDVIRDLLARKKTIVVCTNDMRILPLAGVYLDLNSKPVPRVSSPGQEDAR